jgi:hypothetical protein
MRLGRLVSHISPHMLNQISLKAVMGGPSRNELCIRRSTPKMLAEAVTVAIIDDVISLFLNNHTCYHHLPHSLGAPGSSRVPNNFPM